jgi:hypothetical protein
VSLCWWTCTAPPTCLELNFNPDELQQLEAIQGIELMLCNLFLPVALVILGSNNADFGRFPIACGRPDSVPPAGTRSTSTNVNPDAAQWSEVSQCIALMLFQPFLLAPAQPGRRPAPAQILLSLLVACSLSTVNRAVDPGRVSLFLNASNESASHESMWGVSRCAVHVRSPPPTRMQPVGVGIPSSVSARPAPCMWTVDVCTSAVTLITGAVVFVDGNSSSGEL